MPTVVTPSYRSGSSLVDLADAHQVKIQPVTDLRYRRGGGYQADFTAFIGVCTAGFLRVLVDAAGDGQRHHTG